MHDCRLSTSSCKTGMSSCFRLQVREHLEQAQQQYKAHYDHKHRDVQFTSGEWV
jgi:hypothetical protein